MRTTTAQRHEMILRQLKTQGFVTVRELTDACGASEATLRRDLDKLAEIGLLERTHGGAAPVRRTSPERIDLIEPDVDARATKNMAAKQAIARAAAKLVSAGQTVALDIGTTTFQLAKELSELPVSVYTTSLRIAALLANARPHVYLPGGLVSGTEPSIIGARAADHLSQLNFDTVFIGASSLSDNGVVFDYSLEDTESKRVLLANAQRRVLLMDSSKLSRLSVARVCDLSEIDVLICDAEPPPRIHEKLSMSGAELLLAN